ncbi:MAG: DUF4173 domain-containing protein [Clostridiales Family XIII bacterium]|nr:DUF4173 domain-containing protein [Clostridiales Family XIII bacterium]
MHKNDVDGRDLNDAMAGHPCDGRGYGRLPYAFSRGDALLAVCMLALGFLFWEWNVLSVHAALGSFLFLAIGMGVSLFYLRARGIRQNAASLVALAVLAAGALPFLLYDAIPIRSFLFLFECCAYLYWLACSCGTRVDARLSGFLVSDGVNQAFAVPFGNFPALFRSFRIGAGDSGGRKRVLVAVAGLLVAVPFFALVFSLLVQADSRFAEFMRGIGETFRLGRAGIWLLELAVGVPVACYLYGALHGNVHRRGTDRITKEGSERFLGAARRIPVAALSAPLTLLCAVYALFIGILGSYFFSAFTGRLPGGFSYAEYARQGFFELCGIAALNLVVLAFVHCFARRAQVHVGWQGEQLRQGEQGRQCARGGQPRVLRALTGLLSALTVVLIVTAASKMLLYIDAYGLSRLRVCTLWFMLVLLAVFVILFVANILPRRRMDADMRPDGRSGTGAMASATVNAVADAGTELDSRLGTGAMAPAAVNAVTDAGSELDSRLGTGAMASVAVNAVADAGTEPDSQMGTQVRQGSTGRYIVATCVVLILALFLTDTDGLIARHNVTQYESGRLAEVDVEMLGEMSYAVLPWLERLAEHAPDEAVRKEAAAVLRDFGEDNPAGRDVHLHTWSIQSALLREAHPDV